MKAFGAQKNRYSPETWQLYFDYQHRLGVAQGWLAGAPAVMLAIGWWNVDVAFYLAVPFFGIAAWKFRDLMRALRVFMRAARADRHEHPEGFSPSDGSRSTSRT